jgi:pimeloyl-ACP methyl ester carboxylesterase
MTIQIGSLDGRPFASELLGQGRPVLLLHGWQRRIEDMQPVAERLAPLGYAVHMLDLPGFGRSALPPEPWGAEEYAGFVQRYMDSVALKTASLVGHSFGGRVCIALGAAQPDRVGKIVLTDAAGVPTPPSVRESLMKLGARALELPGLKLLEPGLRRWARGRYSSDDLRNAGALEATFRKLISEDLLPLAARIAAPTLLIWGDLDTETPLWQAKKLEQTIRDAGLVVFQGASHFAYQERLPDFVRIVDTFLKGTP